MKVLEKYASNAHVLCLPLGMKSEMEEVGVPKARTGLETLRLIGLHAATVPTCATYNISFVNSIRFSDG